MALARSKVTSQGQISVPLSVRKKLGITPGSVIEWSEEDNRIVVRRSGVYSSEDIHRTVFPQGAPKQRSLEVLKEGIGHRLREKNAVR